MQVVYNLSVSQQQLQLLHAAMTMLVQSLTPEQAMAHSVAGEADIFYTQPYQLLDMLREEGLLPTPALNGLAL